MRSGVILDNEDWRAGGLRSALLRCQSRPAQVLWRPDPTMRFRQVKRQPGPRHLPYVTHSPGPVRRFSVIVDLLPPVMDPGSCGLLTNGNFAAHLAPNIGQPPAKGKIPQRRQAVPQDDLPRCAFSGAVGSWVRAGPTPRTAAARRHGGVAQTLQPMPDGRCCHCGQRSGAAGRLAPARSPVRAARRSRTGSPSRGRWHRGGWAAGVSVPAD